MRNVTFSLAVLVLVFSLVNPIHAVGPDSVDSVLDENEGLINNYVIAIVRDSLSFDLFIGTICGFSVYDILNASFVDSVTFSASEHGNCVYDLAIGGGGVYIVTGAFEYPVKFYSRQDSIPLRNVTGAYFSMAGPSSIAVSDNSSGVTLFLGRASKGLYVHHLGAMRLYNTSHGLVDLSIQTLLLAEVVANTDWLFVGTQSGVSVFDTSNSTFLSFNDLETIPDPVYSLAHDPYEKRLYVGTNNGLFVYQIDEDGVELEFSLSLDSFLAGKRILSLALDGHELYIGTPDGLHKYNLEVMGLEGTFLLDTEDNMPSNIVTVIFIDDFSSSNAVLYAGTFGGGIAIIKASYEPTWLELYGIYGAVIGGVIVIFIALVRYAKN